MTRKCFVDTKMYAIFKNKEGVYVQPCLVTKVEATGFWAECHNGGLSGHEKGLEFFRDEEIGKTIFFSKDSAQKVIERENSLKQRI